MHKGTRRINFNLCDPLCIPLCTLRGKRSIVQIDSPIELQNQGIRKLNALNCSVAQSSLLQPHGLPFQLLELQLPPGLPPPVSCRQNTVGKR